MLFVETQRIRNRGNGIDAEPMSTIRWSKTEYCLFRIPNSKVIPKKYIVISKKYIFQQVDRPSAASNAAHSFELRFCCLDENGRRTEKEVLRELGLGRGFISGMVGVPPCFDNK